jgi:lysophospholipase L1-like esterase
MDTNTWLRELAHREGVPLLDFEQVFSTEGSGQRRREYTAVDGSHITEAAYRALSAYTAPILHFRIASR